MSIGNIVASWITWSKLTGGLDDDYADRMNHIFTVLVLIVFAIFVTTGTYVNEPIICAYKQITLFSCMCVAVLPGYITRTAALMHKYANYICWINNTYYVPMHEDIPSRPTDRMETEISYYQYIPLILLFSALLFKIPSIVWRSLSGYSGIDLRKIAELSVAANYVPENERAAKVREIAMIVDRWLDSIRQYQWNCFVRLRSRMAFFLPNKRNGTYLVGIYLIVKVLYTVNVISQFFILDAFLGGFFSLWGVEAWNSFTMKDGFTESRRFPRVTLCDFQMRQMDNVNTYTVLCVLPMNIFNEKIFLIIWFWLVLVSCVTLVDLIVWIYRIMFHCNRVSVVKKYLKIHSRIHDEVDKQVCRKFASFLRVDGVFLIRMVQKNSNDILVSELVAKLWDMFLEKKMIQKLIADSDKNGSSLRTVS